MQGREPLRAGRSLTTASALADARAERHDALEQRRVPFVDVPVSMEVAVVPALEVEFSVDLIEKRGQGLVFKAWSRRDGESVLTMMDLGHVCVTT